MKYWIGNCHQAALLSRQNAYDYWLMNFHFSQVFSGGHEYWGQIASGKDKLAKLLLLRWAWIHDAPMLAALLWKLVSLRTCETAVLLDKNGRHVEELLEGVLGGLREDSSEPRESVRYRLLLEEIKGRQLKSNTRRHKLLTHLSLLSDSGLIT